MPGTRTTRTPSTLHRCRLRQSVTEVRTDRVFEPRWAALFWSAYRNVRPRADSAPAAPRDTHLFHTLPLPYTVISTIWAMTDFRSLRPGESDAKTYVPTKQPEARQSSWIPHPDGDQERSRRSLAPSLARAREVNREFREVTSSRVSQKVQGSCNRRIFAKFTTGASGFPGPFSRRSACAILPRISPMSSLPLESASP